MSCNPPRLSSIWYTMMNGSNAPDLPSGAMKKLNHRYDLFDKNINNIVPMLSYGLSMGYISEEQLSLAINEKGCIEQVEAVTKLLAEDFWGTFTKQITTIINNHKNAIRTLIADSLADTPEMQKKLLDAYDNILNFNEGIVDLSLSISGSDVGQYYQDTFAATINFTDAVNSEFNVEKFNFYPRLKNCLYQLIESVMPHQFECPTIYLHECESNWMLDEVSDEETIFKIGKHLRDNKFDESNEDLDIDALFLELEIDNPDPEFVSFLEDYGIEMLLSYYDMDNFKNEVNKLSKGTRETILNRTKSLSKTTPEFRPLASAYRYFSQHVTTPLFPFDSASDIEASSQFFYSFNHPAEGSVIHETMERFYSIGEIASLSMRFDEDLIGYFNNYSIATCIKSLIMAVIELRD